VTTSELRREDGDDLDEIGRRTGHHDRVTTGLRRHEGSTIEAAPATEWDQRCPGRAGEHGSQRRRDQRGSLGIGSLDGIEGLIGAATEANFDVGVRLLHGHRLEL
jgi:hypothetical protein